MTATIEYLQYASDLANLTEYTFSSQALGDADADRKIIVVTTGLTDGTIGSVSVTVGGVSATTAVQVVASTGVFKRCAAIAIAEVPSGTTGDVVVNWGAQNNHCGISLLRSTDLDAITADDTATGEAAGDLSASIDVPVGGGAVAIIASGDGSTIWTGLTEDDDNALGGNTQHSTAHLEFASAQTGLSVTADATDDASLGVIAIASWAEAGGGGATVPALDEGMLVGGFQSMSGGL